MIYLTGDTHGRFERIEHFCERMQTSKKDILLILGDAGLNFHAGMQGSISMRECSIYFVKSIFPDCPSQFSAFMVTMSDGQKALESMLNRNGMAVSCM